MVEIKIRHAEKTFIERDPPRQILHVVTCLPENPATPGCDCEAHYEMMKAIGNTLGGLHGFDGYKIHTRLAPMPRRP
jgi:hypothetical protein